MAMRTGKTKTILDDFGRLEAEGEVTCLLVIAPASLAWTWEAAAREHLSQDLLSRCKIHVWEAKQKPWAAEHMVKRDGSPKILVVNVEALSSVDRARQLCELFLLPGDAMVAVDESTAIKNPSAKRTKFAVRCLRPLAKYRRILSGLPAPRSPLDVYSQFEFLDPEILGFKSYRSFFFRYAVTQKIKVGNRYVDIVVGYRNVDELSRKVAPHSYRVRLEDCYSLPPKMYSTRHVALTEQQRKAYDEVKKKATTQVESGEHITATEKIVQILRMHQILCGHCRSEEGEILEFPENRTKVLMELLAEHDGKAIVWCSYDHDVQKISDAIKEAYGECARFWGGNRATREDEEKRFKSAPTCRHMVATAAAGGKGRRWDEADLVVYYSSTLDLEHRMQSEERTQGVGKAASVMYVDLLVPGTVDQKIIHGLRSKIDVASAITGDGYKEWLV